MQGPIYPDTFSWGGTVTAKAQTTRQPDISHPPVEVSDVLRSNVIINRAFNHLGCQQTNHHHVTERGIESLFAGPVFTREAVTLPRRLRHYFYRSVYVLTLLILMCTCWLVVAGTQIILTVGDMARFGSTLFQVLAPLQLALVTFLAALGSASAVSQEKDRRTLILLLLTRLSNRELVLGKLFASLLNVIAMLVAAIPVFLMITLLGGVSLDQVLRVFCVCFGTALLAGSLGSTISLWREKTFQTLSMTALVLVLWIGIWEAVYAGFANPGNAGLAQTHWPRPAALSGPILLAVHPGLERTGPLDLGGSTWSFLLFTIAGFQPVEPGSHSSRACLESLSGSSSQASRTRRRWKASGVLTHDMEQAADASLEVQAEAARAAHVDSIGRSRKQSWQQSRGVGQPDLVARNLHLGLWAQGGGDSRCLPVLFCDGSPGTLPDTYLYNIG